MCFELGADWRHLGTKREAVFCGTVADPGLRYYKLSVPGAVARRWEALLPTLGFETLGAAINYYLRRTVEDLERVERARLEEEAAANRK